MARSKARPAFEPTADARSEMHEAPHSQAIAKAVCADSDLLGLIGQTPDTEAKPVAPTRKDTPHFHGHRDRLRERFRSGGADALPDYELLELVLFNAHPRQDMKPVAKALIAKFGSFAEVGECAGCAAHGGRWRRTRSVHPDQADRRRGEPRGERRDQERARRSARGRP